MDIPHKNVQELIAEASRVKSGGPLDLSSDEDLSVALMNLVSIEEHLFFTGAKTGKPHYYDLLDEVRNIRKALLKRIVVDYEGEVWCISKHLLASSMRLIEVGTKQLSLGNKSDALDLFDKAYSLYSLFWGLNLDRHAQGSELMTATGATASVAAPEQDAGARPAPASDNDSQTTAQSAPSSNVGSSLGFGARLRAFVSKVIDCCIE